MSSSWMSQVVSSEMMASRSTFFLLSGDEETVERVAGIARLVVAAARSGGRVLVFGNGGSAADAQHLAAELVGRFRRPARPPIDARALSTDTSILTALANDLCYEEVFARQVEACGRPGDVAIGISTSGRSENVLRALAMAHRLGLRPVLLTGQGFDPSTLPFLLDVCVVAPSDDTARIQECHVAVIHAVCEVVDQALA